MFNTYLLNMEETWWVREHPFNVRCVKVKRLVKELEETEARAVKLREELEAAVEGMNKERSNA